jgi:uncharacterized protein (DUF1330 family)
VTGFIPEAFRESLEGDWDPKRVIALKAWYNSPDYSECIKLRLASARGHAIMVDGV